MAMNGTNGDAHPVASRTCTQCKASKKKCDKSLPKCSRCRRLALDCSFLDLDTSNGSETASNPSNSRFDEVFERLQRIEAHIFASPAAPIAHDGAVRGASLSSLAQSFGVANPNPLNWSLEPGTLKPQYMTLILWQSTLATLDEHKTNVAGVAHMYIIGAGQWLPMISRDKFEKEARLFASFGSSDRFLLLVLAMHLAASSLNDHPPANSPGESPWYRKCKHHFAQYVAFGNPSVELIQAGMLIALFEYHQCVEDRALTTLGTCSRLAFLLDFDQLMAKHASRDLGKLTPDEEEAILTWMGLTRLERYFNMSPVAIPKSSCMPLHMDTDVSESVSPWTGPLVSNFSTLSLNVLSNCIYEFDASQRLGRVQKFIRDNYHAEMTPQLANRIKVMTEDLGDYVIVRKLQMAKDGAWAGIHVVLGAAVHLQCFLATKQGTLDQENLRFLHFYVEQLSEVITKCRTVCGFRDNYLEGIQPTWCSLPYDALRAYKMIQDADVEQVLPKLNMVYFMETLQIQAPKYRLADKCVQLLESS